MSKRKLEQPIEATDRTGDALRFSIRQFGARAHQVGTQDRHYRTFGGEGGSSGPCKVLVQNRKPLTPGAARIMANGGASKPEKFLRGF